MAKFIAAAKVGKADEVGEYSEKPRKSWPRKGDDKRASVRDSYTVIYRSTATDAP
jgi:hypothetical protein